MAPTPLQRALTLAPERSSASNAVAEQEFFCFRLGELRLAVLSENVREVIRANLLTPLPRSPAFVLGVCGHRGEVIPVLDLLRFFGRGEARMGPRTRVFVGVAGLYTAGVIADSVIGLRKVLVSQILPAPMVSASAAEHLVGVVNPESREESLSILSLPKLLAHARQRAVTR